MAEISLFCVYRVLDDQSNYLVELFDNFSDAYAFVSSRSRFREAYLIKRIY